jgi:hypothetical protein
MKKHPFNLLLILLLVFNLLNTGKLYAQTATDNKTSQFLPAQIKSFTGKYISNNNKMIFLQMMIKDDHLVLKQSWDGEEVVFKQVSDLNFFNDEHSFPLKFTKNDKGETTQVLAFDTDVWIKVADNYVPQLEKIIQLTVEQLKAFEGKYQAKGGDGDNFLQITAANDHLVLKQLWDEKEISFSPVSPLDFVNEPQTFPLKFTKDKDGAVTQVLAFNKDLWLKVK